MKNSPVALALIVALPAAVVGGVVVSLLRPQPIVSVANEGLQPADSSDLEGRLERIETAQEEAAMERADLLERLAKAVPAGTREPVFDLDAAISRWMREHGSELAVVESAGGARFGATPERTLQEYFDLLTGGTLDDQGWADLWESLREEGRTDEFIAYLEERTANDPTNPDMQVALGGAYLSKTMEHANSPEAGVWAMKADGAFDAALELDENHWEARYTKAFSLSMWPPLFGKQSEAISQFEILLGQQEGQNPQPQFAQTYQLLGNLYQQNGQPEKALDVWKKGLSVFPDDAQLLEQLTLGEAVVD